jgi:hypothetical protein
VRWRIDPAEVRGGFKSAEASGEFELANPTVCGSITLFSVARSENGARSGVRCEVESAAGSEVGGANVHRA